MSSAAEAVAKARMLRALELDKRRRDRDETPEQRKARQDAALMRAAEAGLETATRSGDPSQIKTAIEAMAKVRELVGDNKPTSGNVTIVVEGLDDVDDDHDEPAATAQVQ